MKLNRYSEVDDERKVLGELKGSFYKKFIKGDIIFPRGHDEKCLVNPALVVAGCNIFRTLLLMTFYYKNSKNPIAASKM